MARGRRGRRTSWPRRSTRRPAGGRSTPSTSAAACRSTSPPTRTTPTFARVRAAAARDGPGAVRRALRPGHRVRAVAARQARHGAGPGGVREDAPAAGRSRSPTRACRWPTRTVYAPASWPLRIAAYDAEGPPRRTGPPVAQDVAGPGLLRRRPARRGPRAAAARRRATTWRALDTGAYYFSAPLRLQLALPGPGSTASSTVTADAERADVRFATVREPQTVEEIVAESGGRARRRAHHPAATAATPARRLIATPADDCRCNGPANRLSRPTLVIRAHVPPENATIPSLRRCTRHSVGMFR